MSIFCLQMFQSKSSDIQVKTRRDPAVKTTERSQELLKLSSVRAKVIAASRARKKFKHPHKQDKERSSFLRTHLRRTWVKKKTIPCMPHSRRWKTKMKMSSSWLEEFGVKKCIFHGRQEEATFLMYFWGQTTLRLAEASP